MTFWDLLRSTGRRWVVLVAGIGLTGVLGYLTMDDGVFWSRTEVVFLAPSSELYPNALQTTSEDVIITAGLVAKRIAGPGRVLKYASTDTTLVGIDHEPEEVWLRLPDTGGQWAPHFTDQLLLLEVKGPDAERVRARQQQAIDEIAEVLDALQREAGVHPANDITVTVAPESTVIQHVRGNRIRALGMVALLGATGTIGTVILLEHRARRREECPDDAALAPQR